MRDDLAVDGVSAVATEDRHERSDGAAARTRIGHQRRVQVAAEHSGWSGRRLACRAGGDAESLAHQRSAIGVARRHRPVWLVVNSKVGACVVRGRLPAAGTGTAAGRLRWVGRESERLRRWLTIDALSPAAWLGGTVVSRTATNLAMTLQPGPGAGPGPGPGCRQPDPDDGDAGVGGYSDRPERTPRPASQEGFRSCGAVGMTRRYRPVWLVVDPVVRAFLVRGRLPAPGTGTAAGRLRWVGRESERLRRWLTIDALSPAAWLGGTVVSRTATNLAMTLQPGPGAGPGPGPGCRQPDPDDGDAGVGGYSDRPERTPRPASQEGFRNCVAVGSARRYRPVWLVVNPKVGACVVRGRLCHGKAAEGGCGKRSRAAGFRDRDRGRAASLGGP